MQGEVALLDYSEGQGGVGAVEAAADSRECGHLDRQGRLV